MRVAVGYSAANSRTQVSYTAPQEKSRVAVKYGTTGASTSSDNTKRVSISYGKVGETKSTNTQDRVPVKYASTGNTIDAIV